jgi:hypothetical protein
VLAGSSGKRELDSFGGGCLGACDDDEGAGRGDGADARALADQGVVRGAA